MKETYNQKLMQQQQRENVAVQHQRKQYELKRRRSELQDTERQLIEQQAAEIQRLKSGQVMWKAPGEHLYGQQQQQLPEGAYTMEARASKYHQQAKEWGAWGRSAYEASLADNKHWRIPPDEGLEIARVRSGLYTKLYDRFGVKEPSERTISSLGPYPHEDNYPDSARRIQEMYRTGQLDRYDPKTWVGLD